MTTLSDGTRTISFDPEWTADRNDELIINTARSLGGRESTFLWGTIDRFRFPIEYSTTSDAALMNEWWIDQTDLFLFFDSTSYDARIINDSQPFQSLNKPYGTHWTGTILIDVL
jgi:hypothetical protein